MSARYRKARGRGAKPRRKKRPGGSLPAMIVNETGSEAGANVSEQVRDIVPALVLGADRPGLVEVEAAADPQRGVITAFAEVGVTHAAFDFDAFRHLAAQAEVEKVAVVIGAQRAGVQVDLEVADAADQVELVVE